MASLLTTDQEIYTLTKPNLYVPSDDDCCPIVESGIYVATTSNTRDKCAPQLPTTNIILSRSREPHGFSMRALCLFGDSRSGHV